MKNNVLLVFLFLLIGSRWTEGQSTRAPIDQLSPSEVKIAWEKLSQLIASSGGISPDEIERARLHGVLDRLGKNARLVERKPGNQIETGEDFKLELLPRGVIYTRLGDFSKDNIAQLSTALRKEAKAQAVILDLRATSGPAEFDLVKDLAGLFIGGDKSLFTLSNSTTKEQKNFRSSGETRFNGILLVVINADTNGPGEAAAAALRQQAKALLVGTQTSGQAFEYTSIPLNERFALEVAVSRIVLPGRDAQFLASGVTPDLLVAADLDGERDLLRRSKKEGIGTFIFEIQRPHMNEASLVAGRNPELDAFQARKAEKNAAGDSLPMDRSLQKALDAATALLVVREGIKVGE